jgi:hypothetical protein
MDLPLTRQDLYFKDKIGDVGSYDALILTKEPTFPKFHRSGAKQRPKANNRRRSTLDLTFDLETKPLARALISYAVKSADPISVPGVRAPITHQDLLQLGITRAAKDISDKALLLLGRSSISSSNVLPGDAPVIIGFSLFVMLGIIQALSKEDITLDIKELTDRLIEQHLSQKIRMADNDQAEKKEILEISRIATQIPSQIVETAKGEVEELFSRCYSVIPGFVQGDDKTRAGLMPIFGTALHVLLHSQIEPNS